MSITAMQIGNAGGIPTAYRCDDCGVQTWSPIGRIPKGWQVIEGPKLAPVLLDFASRAYALNVLDPIDRHYCHLCKRPVTP